MNNLRPSESQKGASSVDGAVHLHGNTLNRWTSSPFCDKNIGVAGVAEW
jgi:hypothetical protein